MGPESNNKQAGADAQELVFGKHPVAEALESGQVVEEVLISRSVDRDPVMRRIHDLARAAGFGVRRLAPSEMDALLPGRTHQGVAARLSALEYADFKSLAAELAARERVRVVILDGVQDPRNLGAIIRTAAALGVDAVILTKRRSAAVTPAAVKASAGAVFRIPVARVANSVNAIEQLKKSGFWIYGADAQEGRDYRTVEPDARMALALGAEGGGLRPIVRKNCDHLLAIPMADGVESLNVSVAAGILLSRFCGP